MVQDIHIEEYNYDLPDERIAKFPLPQRDNSKLLIRRKNGITESTFRHLDEYIPENSLLVFNNTKVIQARMIFQKETGAQIEIFCLEPKEPADYAQAFVQNQSCIWLCLVGNSKRWKSGKLFKWVHGTEGARCTVERLESRGETHLVRFEWDNPDLSFADILEKYGELPIPPYLNRKTQESDKETYQTVYSKIKGSVAAPTAGLHFTKEVFESLKKKQIALEELTLHVGAGTFKPVKSETLADHEMHTECISVKKSTIEKLLEKEGQVFAVGTTSVRTLESLYYIGLILENTPNASLEELSISQWFPYSVQGTRCTVHDSLKNILAYMERKGLNVLTTHTQILIAPGYTFKIVNGMITNFHQPKSTLLLLISAFVDGNWREIYDYALNHDFRFLSYGDSSLLM
jgi:S-adenosylmethionine:tRNA ribosyltransferase-isomerase